VRGKIQRRARAASSVLGALLLLSPGCTHPEARMHVIDASALKSRSSFDMEAARASTVPPTVSFRLDGGPTRTGAVVTLNGRLENSGDAPVTVTIFPAAPLGFALQPSPGAARHKPPLPGAPPSPPPAPPAPLQLDLPAMTSVRLDTSVSVDEFDWTPGAARELVWTYLFWNEPKPTGKVIAP
jgi:hypothetical protein